MLVVPTNQRTNQKTLLISQFICRGGTPYGTLGFIPQLPTVMCTYVRRVAAYVVTRTNTATISADDIRTQK